MKKWIPWIIAAASVLAAVWAVSTRQSVLQRACDKTEQLLPMIEGALANKALRFTSLDAPKVKAHVHGV